MNTSKFLMTLFIVTQILSISCEKTTSEDESNLDDNIVPEEITGAYLDQSFPTTTVSRFAPEIFTIEMHAPPIFSPDGDEVYWSLMNTQNLLFMKIVDGVWTSTANAPFNLSGGSDSPFISADGSTLLFLSGHNDTKENIWIVDKTADEWGTPQKLDNNINQQGAHWQASMANNQNLYFGANGDIYFSEFVDGNYSTAQKLSSTFNTEDDYEGSPFIASDESYIIFDRAAPYADLFISFKQTDGSWSEAVSMTELNTGSHELYANVSPDGRFIMFLSGRSGMLMPYWVDASIIDNYRN